MFIEAMLAMMPAEKAPLRNMANLERLFLGPDKTQMGHPLHHK
jgi:hypothetical protein